MSLKKIVLKSTTQMSLNERFTYLRRNVESPVRNIRQNLALQQQASAKNRRLAQQMERRPAVRAALKLKKKSLRQRLGQPNTSIKDRLTLNHGGRFGRARGRGQQGRGRGIRGGLRNLRGSRRGNLSRGQSLLSLNRGEDSNPGQRFRGGLRRAFGNPSPNRSPRRGRGGLRGLRGARGAGKLGQRGGRNNWNSSFRGRGRGLRRGGLARGQGRGRGRGQVGQDKVPTREELDMQLDEYMASTKSTLDRELDQYMNQPTEESWD